MKIHPLLAAFAAFLIAAGPGLAEDGAWKTAYVKRGFVGTMDVSSLGGTSGTQRMRTPLQYGGTKVRVFVRGAHETEVELTRMALVRGADDHGTITGNPFPILFDGLPRLKLAKGLRTAKSDVLEIPTTPGTWYLQEQHAGAKVPYAYEVDRGYFASGDVFETGKLSRTLTARSGIAWRIDVFTTDPRTTILCYGDSITHGYGATPNADQSYPAILGKLLKRPVLNLGQNGDVASQSKYAGRISMNLPGVETVIFLMGINDILGSSPIKSAKDYADVVKQVIADCRQNQQRIYLGTILPAGGNERFDSKPDYEALRQELNAWIARGNGADGVIDFAAAVADRSSPRVMRAEYQVDWVHPSDFGYQRMAEAAAKVLAGK